MKAIRSCATFCLLAAALVVTFSVVTSPMVLADTYIGNTYFEDVPNGNYTFITTSQDGSNSVLGSVMPNWDTSLVTGNGAGALGTKALGIHSNSSPIGTDADNRGRKQALYDLLRNKNQGSSEWERMGSASIVHQMLGKPWGSGGRTITAPEWADLHNRLVENNEVVMNRNKTAPAWQNTAGVRVGASYDIFDTVRYNYSNTSKTTDAWVFTVNGSTVYSLEIICANPLGTIADLPDYTPQEYSLTPGIGSNRADGASIKIGEAVSITNSVTNQGPDKSGDTIWRITRLNYDASTELTGSQKAAKDSANDPCGTFISTGRTACVPSRNLTGQTFNVGQTNGASLGYGIPVGSAPNSKVCFVVSVSRPTQNASPVWRHSAMRCVTVASPLFMLIPTVSLDRDDGSVVEPGDSTEVTNTVVNQGSDPSDQTIWHLTKLVYSPSKTLNSGDKGGRDDGSVPCSTFTADGRLPGNSGCETVQERTDQVFNPSQSISQEFPYNIPDDTPVGTKICFAVSVSRPTYNSTPVWRHSDMWCITVGKKPKLQVWGGDVRSGGKIDTSTSTITSLGSTYGSWAEYGALSIESNSGFGSGSGLNGGSSNAGQSSWSKLTFANTGNSSGCSFGCYNFTLSSSSLASQFTTQSSLPVLSGMVNLNDLASGNYRANSITLSGTTIGQGKTIVIVADETVTIEGSITYEDVPYSNIRDIPQVIIRAPAINIRGGVGQVDAWLLALSADNRGALNTCSDIGVDAELTADICNNRLTINGPVVADIVYLRRTAGSGSQADQRGDPAEIFNLRADAYLWAYIRGSGTSRVQTVYTKELSPRF